MRHHNNQKENFEYFRFETAKNAVEAYHEECRHWHLRGEYTKNKIHPAQCLKEKMSHASIVIMAKLEFTDGVVKLISGKLLTGCQVDFDSIILTTKFPISVKATKGGKNVRIPHGLSFQRKM